MPRRNRDRPTLSHKMGQEVVRATPRHGPAVPECAGTRPRMKRRALGCVMRAQGTAPDSSSGAGTGPEARLLRGEQLAPWHRSPLRVSRGHHSAPATGIRCRSALVPLNSVPRSWTRGTEDPCRDESEGSCAAVRWRWRRLGWRDTRVSLWGVGGGVAEVQTAEWHRACVRVSTRCGMTMLD